MIEIILYFNNVKNWVMICVIVNYVDMVHKGQLLDGTFRYSFGM